MEPTDFEFNPTPSQAPAPAPSSRDDGALVPFVNRDARLYSIAITNPIDPQAEDGGQRYDASGRPELTNRRVETIKLHPGLNYIPLAQVKKAQIVRDGRSALEIYQGRCEIADPHALPIYEAIKLIGMTHSKSALQHWQSTEQRPEVKAAIAGRLPLAKAT